MLIYTSPAGAWLVCYLAGCSAAVTLVNLLHFCVLLPYQNRHVSLPSTLILKVLRDMH
jgi:hypothetical protein